jgi:hypothetical protein
MTPVKTSRAVASRAKCVVADKLSHREIIEILCTLQKKNKTKPHFPRPSDRVGFALSSKDRYLFTLQTLQSLDTEGGFDLVWNDDSKEPGVPALTKNYKFQNARLAEVNFGVGGGPDRAVCFGLTRLLQLGYDYVGLIENDILFRPGWFAALMEVFSRGAEDGIVCGSATARSFESHVLEYRDGYGMQCDIGAGMLLFSRPAAEIIVDLYSRADSLQMTTHTWIKFYADLFGLNLQSFSPFWAYPPEKAFPCTLDWGYSPSLYLRGYASLSTIPTYATDLQFDVQNFFHTNYVGPEKSNSGVAYPQMSVPPNAHP